MYESMRAKVPRTWPIQTSGAWLVRFMQGITKYFYILNTGFRGFVIRLLSVEDNGTQSVASFGPQGHGWQDLC